MKATCKEPGDGENGDGAGVAGNDELSTYPSSARRLLIPAANCSGPTTCWVTWRRGFGVGAGVAGMEEEREPPEAPRRRDKPAASWSGEGWRSRAPEGPSCCPATGVWEGVTEGVAGWAGERRELVELVRLRSPRSIGDGEKRGGGGSCPVVLIQLKGGWVYVGNAGDDGKQCQLLARGRLLLAAHQQGKKSKGKFLHRRLVKRLL